MKVILLDAEAGDVSETNPIVVIAIPSAAYPEVVEEYGGIVRVQHIYAEVVVVEYGAPDQKGVWIAAAAGSIDSRTESGEG